jgi:ribosomal protein S18 acetylase RimI-like enzyme
MSLTRFSTTHQPNFVRYQELFTIDPTYPHVHLVDMPFRLTSPWQDQGCELGVWKQDTTMVAWAVFQPPWRNIDYAIVPSERGSSLEQELLAWGKEQMKHYSLRTGKHFYGSVELYEDTPHLERTEASLHALGFDTLDASTLRLEKLDASILRFEIDLQQAFPEYQLPEGYIIRPLRGKAEAQESVHLMNAVFGSNWMTNTWRLRTFEHPAYRPAIDLVVTNPDNHLVGFCSCWLWHHLGQIEPLGVHPDYQRMGLGRALELAAMGVVWNQGARLLYVDHGSSNEKARALSRKAGFRQINNALKYYIHTTRI